MIFQIEQHKQRQTMFELLKSNSATLENNDGIKSTDAEKTKPPNDDYEKELQVK